MIITPLGHTEFLADITNSAGVNVRILVDSWLSDYAIGDMMERTVKVALDPEKMRTIDAIYISHAHCDHFDPYSLMEIFGTCHCEEGSNPVSGKQRIDCHVESHGNSDSPRNDRREILKKPLLILPFTLRYLEPLLVEYLPNARIHWLTNRETLTLKGIEITGYMWPNPVITNEDDVMMIAISSDRELLFAEIDTVPDMEDLEVQKSLFRVFSKKGYETACYLASRNCLEGQIPYYDVAPEKRKAFRDQYIASQKEEIQLQYERYEYEEFADHPNLFALPGFVRGFIGQGIAYPSALSTELNSLSLFPLDELVSIESDYARNAGYSFPQKALIPGRQYRVENGTIEAGRKECPIGALVNSQKSLVNSRASDMLVDAQDDEKSNSRLFASGPLFPRVLSGGELEEGKKKILEILNTRFLPYWSASPVASLRDVLIKNNGVYRVEFKIYVIPGLSRNLVSEHGFLHTQEGQHSRFVFEYSTSRSSFIEVPYIEKITIDEDYWLLDVLGFLEGRQEMYSSFWHQLDPKKAYRLWTCLGATYMNHDLVLAKYRLHLERAKRGLTAEDFVEVVLKNLISK